MTAEERDALLAIQQSLELFVVHILQAKPTDQQIRAIRAIDSGKRRIAIRSGHGTGKSTLLAWILLWRLCTQPYSVIPCTAPTAHQLSDVLWGEVTRWARKMPDYFRGKLDITTEAIRIKESPQSWYAVARTARKENPEALQGFHAESLAFLIDEASGIPEEIFQVAEGALSTPNALVIMAGNPTRREGTFFDAFHSDRQHWETFQFSSAESSLVEPGFCERMAARYGIDSDVYRVRVLGDFPNAESDALISLSEVEAAHARTGTTSIEEREPLVYGIDVARFGDDETVLLRRRGRKVISVEAWRGFDLMATTGRIANYALQERPKMIFVDSIGLGAGVVDRLKEQGFPVRAVNVAERAKDPVQYADLRSELWFALRDWLSPEGGGALPDDEELMAQLCTVKYGITSSGKMRIESKDDRKKRGLSSPDRADALMLTFAAPVTNMAARPDVAKLLRKTFRPADAALGF